MNPTETIPTIIAFDALRDRCGGDDAAKRILETFPTRAKEFSSGIGSAIHYQELSEVRRLSHTFQGSAANASAVEVSRYAGQIEAAARDGDGNRCQELHQQMLDAIDVCQREIAALLAE